MTRKKKELVEPPRFQVAVDVGGTFTDVCALDRDTGALSVAKTPSTPADPSEGLIRGLAEVGVTAKEVALLVHGTTVATNALITRSFPRAAMVTTAGFRDVIEIRRGNRRDLWDAYAEDVAPPYVERRDRLTVRERTDFSGTVTEPLHEEGARAVASTLRRRGVEAVAVCFINSFTNPANEQRMKEILLEELPDVPISVSSEVLPEIFEHERFSTTVANAVLSPVIGRYISTLDRKLEQGGTAGDLLLLHCGGGVMSPSAAEQLPARLASSGTAAGAIAASRIAQMCGYENAIGLDMGGTSGDISLVHGGELRMTRDWSVEWGYPIRFPSIEVLTIGAGGGSHAWIDAGGSLRNGPQSAGSEPGPVCYGRGGTVPTNTDANLVLGRLGETLVGGAMTLDRETAEAAIESAIGDRLDLTVDAAANAILRVANANMTDVVRRISIGRGYDPRTFSLVAFGGAGPLHATAIARELSIPNVVVPPSPGVASALGCLMVDVRHDMTRMFLAPADGSHSGDLDAAFEELEAEARSLLASEGISADDATLRRSMDMRYAGQWRSLTVNVRPGWGGLERAVERFHAEHEREYSYRRDQAKVEIYQLHVTAIGATPKAELKRHPQEPSVPEPTDSRRVVFESGAKDSLTPVFDRSTLKAGSVLQGPAIIEQLDSTTVVPPGVMATVDEWLNIRIDLNGRDTGHEA